MLALTVNVWARKAAPVGGSSSDANSSTFKIDQPYCDAIDAYEHQDTPDNKGHGRILTQRIELNL